MFAYVVIASLPAYGPAKFRMLVYCNGDKAAARAIVEKHGLVVKKVSHANADDISELKDYREVLRWIGEEVAKRKQTEALNAALAKEAQRQLAEQQRREQERQRREREERRQAAIARTVGDVLSFDPEGAAQDNTNVAEICAKALLFFDGAAVNKSDVYTSISLDYARLQATAKNLPKTLKLVQLLVRDLNSFLAVEAKITESQHRVQLERQSADGKINAIGSRTHIFGGSGDGLLLSWLFAEMAVNQDRKDVQSIASRQNQIERDFVNAYNLARGRQRLLEVRARTAISVLMPSAENGSGISLDFPPDIESLATLVG